MWWSSPRALALAAARHFVTGPITRARVAVEQYGWTRLPANPHAFHRTGDLVRTTTVVHDASDGTSIVSGLKDLVVLKTTESEFHGFPREQYTTLPETSISRDSSRPTGAACAAPKASGAATAARTARRRSER